MTADELWEKYSYLIGVDEQNFHVLNKERFISCMTEYGEHIKAEAVKVCKNEGAQGDPAKHYACHDCAAAIEKMPLP